MTAWLELTLLGALIVIGIELARLRHLFAAALLTGFFSLLCAAYYLVVDAVDVAITEAAVGAGIVTVLMLGALALTEREERSVMRHQLLALTAGVAVLGMFLYGLQDVPAFGDPKAPVHGPDAPAHRYIYTAPQEIGVPNLVTGVLSSYRGYDTLGETVVIFTAGIAVFALLGGRQKRGPRDES